MLPEVGMTEFLVIAIAALIVVGPKDLPVLMRRFGAFMAKMRGMASDFRASFDEMARQSELDELRKEVEAMRRGQFGELSSVETEMKATVGEIDQALSEVGVQLHPPMSYQYDEMAAPPPAEASPQPEAAPSPERKPRKPRAARAGSSEAAATSRPRAPRKPKPVAEGGS